jgi:hypothetical protein
MSIALIGGMDRLERHYISEAEKQGISLKVFSQSATGIMSKIKNMDAVVIFTNKVSHQDRREVMNVAKTRNIPVVMLSACGVCSLRDCFSCLNNNNSSLRSCRC